MSEQVAMPPAPERAGRTSRVRAWVISIVVVNAVFLIWLLSGVFMRAMRGCESYVGNDKALCESANGGTPAGTVILLWILANTFLLVLWFARRHGGRIPPSVAE